MAEQLGKAWNEGGPVDVKKDGVRRREGLLCVYRF